MTPEPNSPLRDPSHHTNNVNDDDDVPSHSLSNAIHAATIRISSAESWYNNSLVMLERAKAQVELSQKELNDAQDYLKELKKKKSCGSSSHQHESLYYVETANNARKNEEDGDEDEDDGINLMSSLSGESIQHNKEEGEKEENKSTNALAIVPAAAAVAGGEESTILTQTTTTTKGGSSSNGGGNIVRTKTMDSHDTKLTECTSGEASLLTTSEMEIQLNETEKEVDSMNVEGLMQSNNKKEDNSAVVGAAASSAAVAVAGGGIAGVISNEEIQYDKKEEDEDDKEVDLHKSKKKSTEADDTAYYLKQKSDESSQGESVNSKSSSVNSFGPSPKRGIKTPDESYEEFLSVISESSDKTFEDDTELIDDLIQKCKTVMVGSEVQVTGCGVSELNGVYTKFAESDGVPTYAKIGKFEGQEVMCTISRWQCMNGTRKWYITAAVPGGSGGGGNDKSNNKKAQRWVFYVVYAPSFFERPPRKNWMKVVEGHELYLAPEYKGKGIDPSPSLILETRDESSGRKSLGKQISCAFSTGSSVGSRGSSRRRRGNKDRDDIPSLNSLGSASTATQSKKKRYTGEIPTSVYLPPSLLGEC